MVDLIIEYPNSGGGGNAGSSFDNNFFNVYRNGSPDEVLYVNSIDGVAGGLALAVLKIGGSGFAWVFPVGGGALPALATINSWGALQIFQANISIDLDAPATIGFTAADFSATGDAALITIADVFGGGSITLKGPANASIVTSPICRFPVITGTFPVRGDDADPPAAGTMGKVDRTAQAAAVSATNLTNTMPAGYYVVHYTLEDTTTQIGAATVQFQINYTDDVGATTQVGAALTLTTTGRDRGVFEVYLLSGDITYQTNVVGIIGAGRYALRVRIEAHG